MALLVAAGTSALAQGTAPAQQRPSTQGSGAPEYTPQLREHLHVEDAGVRVDEERYGGQTQSITVQPKTHVPAYEVEPANATNRFDRDVGPGRSGPRTWKILDF